MAGAGGAGGSPRGRAVGGRSADAGGGAAELLLSTFTRVGLTYELDATTAARRRLEALGSSPARAGTRESRSVGEKVLDVAGEALGVDGIDDVPWADLDHAYGPATDVPARCAA